MTVFHTITGRKNVEDALVSLGLAERLSAPISLDEFRSVMDERNIGPTPKQQLVGMSVLCCVFAFAIGLRSHATATPTPQGARVEQHASQSSDPEFVGPPAPKAEFHLPKFHWAGD